MSPDYAAIGLTMASIFFILQVVSITLTIWYKLRRNPPIDQTLKDYTLKEDFDKHCESNDKVFTQLFNLQRKTTEDVSDDIKDLSKNLSSWQLGMAHQVGRLDGRISSMEKQKNEQ